MEAYDLSHKLAYAGLRCPVPFRTGPEFTNSVPGVPVLSMLRVFITPEHWSLDNVKLVAKEICRILGPTEQYDVGITLSRQPIGPNMPAAGVTARLTKLDPREPNVVLRISDGLVDRLYVARFPQLRFEEKGEDAWRAHYAPGAVKPTGME